MLSACARLTALLAATLSANAIACSCAGTPSPEQAFARYANVLHVRVAHSTEVTPSPGRTEQRGVVEVIEVFKRSPSLPAEVTFSLPATGSSCELHLQPGAMILVFFNGASITATDLNGCSPSRLAAIGDPDLVKLRSRKAHSGDES